MNERVHEKELLHPDPARIAGAEDVILEHLEECSGCRFLPFKLYLIITA